MPKPKGLKKSAKEAAKIENAKEVEETGEIILENCEDEYQELQAIYSTACEEMAQENFEQAQTFFRASIHESDRILRAKGTEDGLPASFHEIYALSLFHLAHLMHSGEGEDKEEGESSAKFVEAALERMKKAVDLEKTWSRAAAIAQLLLASAQNLVIEENGAEADKKVNEAILVIEDAFGLADFCSDDLVPLVSQLRDDAEMCGNSKWIEAALGFLDKIGAATSKEFNLVREYATTLLANGNINYENLVFEDAGDDEEIFSTQVDEKLLSAIKYLEKAHELAQDETSKLEISVLMCECHLQLGNIQLDNDKANIHHKKSIELFDLVKSQQPELLPEDFEEMVEDLKAELAAVAGH